MKLTLILALALATGMPAAASAASPPPVAPLTVAAADGFLVLASIEGQPVRLRVDPAIGRVVLNPGVAAKLGLKPNFLSSIMKPMIAVGPERIAGTQAGGSIAIGTWSRKMPIIWFERDIVSDADGLIGIADLPHQQVTMQLRPAAANDASFTYSVSEADLLGLVHEHRIGEKEITTRFSLHQPVTQASASAGAVLAAERGGTWAGEALVWPILFGVSRPARPMAFARAVSLNGMTLDRLLIRTSDYRGGYLLPTDPSADPNEIIVTGNKAKGKAHLRLTVAGDRLSTCSSVTYVRQERRLTLVCPKQL